MTKKSKQGNFSTFIRDLCETAELCLSYNCEDEEDRTRTEMARQAMKTLDDSIELFKGHIGLL